MKRLSILIAFCLFLCSTASTFQDGGGKSTKKPKLDVVNFCGTWQYNDSGSKGYLKIGQTGAGTFKLTKGFEYPKGEISWADGIAIKNADGIYLKPLNGNLVGRFVSGNFYATHGMDFTYRITCELKSDSKLIYSVWSSIRGETETREATRIRD